MSHLTRRKFELAMMASLGMAPALSLSDAELASQNVQPQPSQPGSGSITDVEGIRVGHFTDPRRPTGCTALLFDGEAAAGVDYDGSAPGDQLGVMLQPSSPVETIHALLLAGAGPFGLAAVPGVVRYLEEHKMGFDWGVPNLRIPIVVGAVIDDLMLGDAKIRPDPEAAYKACVAASTGPIEEGNVGAGSGATVGKMLRSHGLPGMKSGIGTASVRVGEVTIGALAVVNAAGDIVDWRRGEIVAGARTADGKGFANIVETLKRTAGLPQQAARIYDPPFHSTTLLVVATNAEFNKTELTKIAMMASTGAARAINPYHTTGDGDSTFALSTRRVKSEIGITATGTLAADTVSHAVLRAVEAAKSVEGWIAMRDLPKQS